MSCAFCHVGPNPVKPPADPENPQWENLSSNVGAQYFWVDRIFNWQGDRNAKSFFFQLFHTSRPGTLDTSLVSTDNINNPRTMNAVYYLGPAHGAGQALGQGDARRRRARQQAVQRLRAGGRSAGAVLRGAGDGLDAARAEGRLRFGRRARRAQPRLPQHRAVQRGVAAPLPAAHRRRRRSRRSRSPTRRKNSVYWQATEQQTPNMARFFLGEHRPALSEGRAGRRRLPHRRRRHARARQDGLRRALRPLPLEQAAAAAAGPRHGELQRQGLSRVLEPLLGVDEDRRRSRRRCGRSCSPTIS